MSIGINVDNIVDEIGTQDFFHAFFSTICFHLENRIWGSVYPNVMHQLYSGELHFSLAEPTKKELLTIRSLLKKIPPTEVVWDIEDLNKRPPWGEDVSADITSLGNYFVTSTGRDLFEVLLECLDALISNDRGSLKIEQL